MVEEQQRPVNTDVPFEVLANEHRRHVIRSLCEHETPISIAELAREVAVRKYEANSPEIPDEEMKRARVLLHHSHLPKLADAGLVTYDPERNLVDTAASTDLESVLELYPI
ncbi:hypothetical protein CV102_23415 [Natronococcus pandeyae]|uniref:DUF7344 domain-containing protein n=1 Tax=Natronococcus pandeyae TaxID=2055836 RepID=A0A8J8TQ01_9EURY|nr:helix-turn-helix transcriptional regulator [Natronococcus pandeyae]TYL36234.1 hypothetical protein CV102_23415 [Natronococcus pandeyae]